MSFLYGVMTFDLKIKGKTGFFLRYLKNYERSRLHLYWRHVGNHIWAFVWCHDIWPWTRGQKSYGPFSQVLYRKLWEMEMSFAFSKYRKYILACNPANKVSSPSWHGKTQFLFLDLKLISYVSQHLCAFNRDFNCEMCVPTLLPGIYCSALQWMGEGWCHWKF